MKPARFDYLRPDSLEDAIAVLAAHQGDAKIIAGGQSLMPMLCFRLAAPRLLVDIGRIPGLNQINISADAVRLGALVRWVDIERDARLANGHPLLVEAVRHVAHYQIRNRGTVGGSIAHADPAAELPGVAVACEAKIAVTSRAGQRTIAAVDFFTGIMTTALQADEVIVEMQLPAWSAQRRWAFQEFARRKGDFALAGIALFYDCDSDGRAVDPHIAAFGVSDRPVRLKEAENAIAGRVVNAANVRESARVATNGVAINGDIHAPADYRQALLRVLLERGLYRAAGLAPSG
jgi:aerobic carbon-monoxide dehydrogenase medium subunit